MTEPAQGPDEGNTITVVSGLPRSGTSMMMKMLEAGGLPPLTDGERRSDDDNPLGYFEFERVKALPKGDHAWLDDTRGKVVKVISALLEHLPADHTYRVIFMARSLPEVLASQKKMLVNRGEPTDKVTDEELSGLYEKHLAKLERWLAEQAHMSVLHVSYNDVLRDPSQHAAEINRFLGGSLDEARMTEAVRPDLYRQRST